MYFIVKFYSPMKKKTRIYLTRQPISIFLSSFFICRWFKHISDAAEAYKSRTKGNHDISEDPIPATLSNSPTKESLEGTPEKELSPPIAHNDPSNVSISESQKNISNDANEQNNNSDVKDVHDEKQIGRGDTMEDDEEEVKIRHRKYSSGTRILTQQQSLIDPSEVQISVSPVLTAEPVLTPQGECGFFFLYFNFGSA